MNACLDKKWIADFLVSGNRERTLIGKNNSQASAARLIQIKRMRER
jgi:hypothetical protein